MRIAFLDTWTQTSVEGGGTAVGIGKLREALVQRGHHVARFAPFTDRPGALTVRRLLFNVHLPMLLRRLEFDLVVGFDIDGVFWAAQRGCRPYVVSVKGVIAEELRNERGIIRWFLWMLSRLERHNVRHADGVLATSIYCRDAIAYCYGVPVERICCVPEGVDLAYWQDVAAVEPRSSDGATILCVAHQYPRKHVADLLRALPIVRRAIPQAHAVIVGGGPQHAMLRGLMERLGLAPAVQLLGNVPDDMQVARLYRHADVFCLPSVQEGFGIVFLEAMANGLPVVATTSSAVPEVIPDQRAGILVAPGDVRALAQALIELLQDPERCAAMGVFGMNYVKQYDWGCVAERFLAQVASFIS